MSDEVDAALKAAYSRLCLTLAITTILTMNSYLLGALDVDVISGFSTMVKMAFVAIWVYPFLPLLFIGMDRLEVRLRQQLGRRLQEVTDE